ncbi:hypothetical protein [uncultured Modestobacter sp.]|uniref:hypothetical protein n=1 Tax=uncultured Modestobacter sp. TaxID=380048 RepID=UPI00261BD165|nr:hypothetical protein [uncultured Modestobacter sp.]
MRSAPDRPTGRRAAAAVLAVLGVGGLAGCGQDEADPGGVTAEQLQDVRDDVATLSERVDELEAARSSAPPTAGETSAPATTTSTTTAPAEPTPTFAAGDDVSLGGEVTGLISTTAVGSAFRLATGEGVTVTVISPTPVAELATGDAVQVSGVATRVQRSSFERDFGIAAEVLLDDPDAFLTEHAGQLAVAADRVQRGEQPAD